MLFHLHILCITETSILCCAAVVAVPILKLWPAYLEASMPICVKSLSELKHVFVDFPVGIVVLVWLLLWQGRLGLP